ncbi:MAG: rod shape-determining protein RodA [Desulfuromonadaceae bacterium]|nr:rod shape-determining protein RodA [Desulfuromonadaceae bacterium]
MFDRRLLTHFDFFFLSLIMAVSAVGILNLFSATYSWPVAARPIYQKQIFWLMIGLSIAFTLCLFDYRRLRGLAWPLYMGAVLLLGWAALFGKVSMGARRWIDLGFFNLQPSEIMKIVIIIALAYYFSNRSYPQGCALPDLAVPFLLLGIPFVLILRQPDLGTALIVIFIGATLILFVRIRPRSLLLLGGIAAVAPWFGWFFLKDYQKARIQTFLDPESDPLGAGYHIIQSKIAVGGGGFWGRGFLKGPQSQLSFLPERHTDFAFSVFAEEWGFIGCMGLLFLYFLIIIWGIYIAYRSTDKFGRYLSIGVTGMLFWHAVVNLGMVIGLLPVVGVPLPLFSYGGTNMVTTMTGVGLLLNVSMRRYMF